MADSRIKGITIELDGEATGLQKALSDVTKQSVDIQKELKDVDRLLKFDPSNVEAMAQKQKLLASQIEVTSEKLNRLKAAEEQVNEQFQRGDIAEAQFRAFRREIEYTEGSLSKLKQSLSKIDDVSSIKEIKEDLSKVPEEAEKAEGSIKELGGELTSILAGAAAAGGIGGVLEKALDTSGLNTKINISMELDQGSQDIVKNAISTVESYGVDAEAALEGVRRQWALNKDASDESNAAVVQGAATIIAAYGDVDFTELIQETNELSKTLDIGNEDAMGLVYSLLKMGFPPDQLDIITEYGSQLHNAGYNAQEIQAIMAAGVETGSWNIDVLLDGLKEGRIRMAEFGQGVSDSVAALLDGTGISATQLQEWGKAVAAGGESGKQAMNDVAAAVVGIDDKTKQNAVGVSVFGTLWEENGTKITDTILGMSNNIMTAEANQNNLNGAMQDLNSDPAIQMQQAISNLTTALAPLLLTIAGVVSAIAGWVSNNPNLTATIVAIVSTIGILIGICAGLAPIFTAISTAAGILGVGIGAIAAPVAIVIAIIAALITIGILLYKNWDEISAKASVIWSEVAEFFSEVWAKIKTGIINAWNGIKTFFSQAWADISSSISISWNAIKSYFSQVWIDIQNSFVSIIGAIVEFVKSSWEGLKSITAAAFNAIMGVISNIWNSIKNTVSTLVDSILSTISSKFESMKSAVSEKMNNVKSTISEVWNEAQAFLEGIDLVQIGKNAIQGLIDGIKSMVGAVARAIRNIADTITDGIKDALDIHSPSRVLKQLGIYTGEGFGLGIQSTIGLIAKQAKAMAAAAIPSVDTSDAAFALSSGKVGGAGINQTVNIYSPAALSPAETARQNKKALQEFAFAL